MPARPDLLKSGESRWPGVRFEGFLRLHREANRDVGGTVKGLEHLIAEHATVLALGAGTGRQLDATIAGVTGRAHQVGFLHAGVMPRLDGFFQPAPITFSSCRVYIRARICTRTNSSGIGCT